MDAAGFRDAVIPGKRNSAGEEKEQRFFFDYKKSPRIAVNRGDFRQRSVFGFVQLSLFIFGDRILYLIIGVQEITDRNIVI